MQKDISVIIPTYNRHRELRNCLNSVKIQSYPKGKFEVLIIDDESDNKTLEIIRSYESFLDLKYFSQEHKGPAAARNLGVRNAESDLVAFIDDDCVMDKDWVKFMVEGHKNSPSVTAIGGETDVPSEKGSVLVGQFLSNGSIETYYNGKIETVFFPTCNVSIKKDVLLKNPFNEKFPLPGGEDLEFFWRIFKNGHKLLWDRKIKVVHYRDSRLISFLRQAYYYGRGNLLVKYLHDDQPLLKELKTGNLLFFWATLVNIIKIPRFCYLLGNRLIIFFNINGKFKSFSVYVHLFLHKVAYIIGNIVEFFRLRKDDYTKANDGHMVPRLLILDVTHSCNLRCNICDIWKTGKKESDLDIRYVKKVLCEAQALKIPELALSGGEPLLRNDIFEIFEFARNLKIKNLGILSNGLIVNKYFDKLKPFLIDKTISLVVSFDSLTPELHNYIRNMNSAWQITKEALNKLASLKKDFPQISFNIISIILDGNLEELTGLAEFAKSLGVDFIQFQALLSNNLRMAERLKSEFWVTEKNWPVLDKSIDQLILFAKANPGFIKNSPGNLLLMKKYYRGLLSAGEVKCFSGSNTVLVANQGTYSTCFSSYGEVMTKSLQEVLRGKDILRARIEVNNCPWPCLLPCFTDLGEHEKHLNCLSSL